MDYTNWSGLVKTLCKMSNVVEKKVGLHSLQAKAGILEIQFSLFVKQNQA